jgi:hypothetical protein
VKIRKKARIALSYLKGERVYHSSYNRNGLRLIYAQLTHRDGFHYARTGRDDDHQVIVPRTVLDERRWTHRNGRGRGEDMSIHEEAEGIFISISLMLRPRHTSLAYTVLTRTAPFSVMQPGTKLRSTPTSAEFGYEPDQKIMMIRSPMHACMHTQSKRTYISITFARAISHGASLRFKYACEADLHVYILLSFSNS